MPGFAELLRKGQTAPVQVMLDGTDSNTALIALGYINQIASWLRAGLSRAITSAADRARRDSLPRIDALQERPWYNPNLEQPMVFRAGHDRHAAVDHRS